MAEIRVTLPEPEQRCAATNQDGVQCEKAARHHGLHSCHPAAAPTPAYVDVFLLERLVLPRLEELAGEASLCWDEPSVGTFQAAQALAAAKRAASYIARLALVHANAHVAALINLDDDVARARRERDLEARLHAACLSIAEGAPGWQEPILGERPAQVSVRALRKEVEEIRARPRLTDAQKLALRPFLRCVSSEIAFDGTKPRRTVDPGMLAALVDSDITRLYEAFRGDLTSSETYASGGHDVARTGICAHAQVVYHARVPSCAICGAALQLPQLPRPADAVAHESPMTTPRPDTAQAASAAPSATDRTATSRCAKSDSASSEDRPWPSDEELLT